MNERALLRVGAAYHDALSLAVTISWALNREQKRKLIALLMQEAARIKDDDESALLQSIINYTRYTDREPT